MSSSFSGKVIAISGGASGIGLATAKLLVSQGANVSISDIDDDALQRATKDILETCGAQHKGNILAVAADVRSTAQVKAWIDSTIDKFGKLTGGANMAGITGHEPTTTAANIEDDLWERIIGVNLTGVMMCQREQLRVMQDGGSVVNCASVAGIRGVKGQAAYSASKHGVVGLSKSAAKEMAARKIRINVVAPGLIDTPMIGGIKHMVDAAFSNPTGDIVPLNRIGKPQEVASLVAFLLGDEAAFITGTVQVIDGGVAA